VNVTSKFKVCGLPNFFVGLKLAYPVKNS